MPHNGANVRVEGAQMVDLTTVWPTLVEPRELNKFQEIWERARQDVRNDVWHPSTPLSIVALQDLIVGIAVLGIPRAKWPCLHHLLEILCAQCGNLLDLAVPALTKTDRIDLPLHKKARRDPQLIREQLKACTNLQSCDRRDATQLQFIGNVVSHFLFIC